MTIGLIDMDGHNIPNLALMKLAWLLTKHFIISTNQLNQRLLKKALVLANCLPKLTDIAEVF